MKVKQFSKGTVIFSEGKLGNCMYEVQTGRVGILVGYGTEDEKKLTELSEGRSFGEMAVIETVPRSATAVALEDTSVLEISAADLDEYFQSRPDKLLAIMRGMTRRLRELTRDYLSACQTVGEWNGPADGATESGLMAGLRKLAAFFEEGLRYSAYANRANVNFLYYSRDAFMD